MEHISEAMKPMQQNIAAARGFEMEWIACPVCKSPKEAFKTAHFVYKDGRKKTTCNSCEDKLKGWEEQEKAARLELAAAERFYHDHSLGLSQDLQNARFDTFQAETLSQKEALENVKLCVERLFSFTLENANVLIQGVYGIGKSHLGAAAAHEVNKRGCKAIFINVPDLLTEIKSTWHKNSEYTEKDVLKWIINADLLVLDDIGSTMVTKDNEATKLEIEKLFQITNGRQGKATIYTTNLTGEKLRQHVGDRVLSRIVNKTKCIPMEGTPRRKPLDNLGF